MEISAKGSGVRAVTRNQPHTIATKLISGSPAVIVESPDLLELKNRLKIRTMLCWFLMMTLGFSIACCFALIFVYLWRGHEFSEAFVKWLCGATVAQIAVFLGVFVRSVWHKVEKKPAKSGK
jgi:hypothetical protein